MSDNKSLMNKNTPATPTPESIPLERQQSDLRIAPAEPDESWDMNDALNHYDLRIVAAAEDTFEESN